MLPRLRDLTGLILSQLLTLFGMIRFASLDEIVNKRKPARFMRWNERKRRVNQFNRGFLLDGQVGRFPEKVSFQSMITVGGMGVGKSANLVIPNILTARNCSLVITDTSGELYEQTSGYLASQGYAIKTLNLIEPGKSDSYNPLARVNDYIAAERVAHILISARGSTSLEPIWDEGAKRLLRILIRTLKNREPKTPATLPQVLDLLNRFDAHTQDSELDTFIVDHTLDDQATYQDYRGFTTATTEKMMLSFVSTAATSLTQIGNPEIAALLSTDSFDFTKLKQQKIAVYVLVRQQDMQVFSFLLSLFYTDLCHQLLRDRAGKLPVYLLLDEFGQMTIPEFEVFATTARKYRVGFWLFLQSLSQLESRYSATDAQIILDGIGTQTYFGGMDVGTAQKISDRVGQMRKLDLLNIPAGQHVGPLLRPDELIRLGDNQMIVLSGNRDPFIVSCTPYYKRGELRRRAGMGCARSETTGT